MQNLVDGVTGEDHVEISVIVDIADGDRPVGVAAREQGSGDELALDATLGSSLVRQQHATPIDRNRIDVAVAIEIRQRHILGIPTLQQLTTLDEDPLDCGAGSDTCPCELTGWRPISGEEGEDIMHYPGPDELNSIGTYRVVVKDDDDGDDRLIEAGDAKDQNTTILIRSYGISNQGSRRMLEATVTKSF